MSIVDLVFSHGFDVALEATSKSHNFSTELEVTRSFISTRKLYHHDGSDLEEGLLQLPIPDVNSVTGNKLKTKYGYKKLSKNST